MGDLAANPQVSRHSMTATEIAERFWTDAAGFDEMARAAFEGQVASSPTYGRFAAGHEWTGWSNAPFLPVEAFKWDGIVEPDAKQPEIVFSSSGTGGRPSRHPVLDVAVYERSVLAQFKDLFGEGPFKLVAHLPTYGASGDPSSLIYMVDLLIRRFGSAGSKFAESSAELEEAVADAGEGESLMIFGTAFGLLDIVEQGSRALPANARIIETGGMKTYRREITRSELHRRLADGFGIPRNSVWSEYGMCELLSQCYTRGGEVFYPPSWMRFKVVDVDDPDVEAEDDYPGLLALFDLANVFSVSAVLTSDLAVRRSRGFELIGRADAAEVRGCNFLLHPDP